MKFLLISFGFSGICFIVISITHLPDLWLHTSPFRWYKTGTITDVLGSSFSWDYVTIIVQTYVFFVPSIHVYRSVLNTVLATEKILRILQFEGYECFRKLYTIRCYWCDHALQYQTGWGLLYLRETWEMYSEFHLVNL
jgi:hypothetical protein